LNSYLAWDRRTRVVYVADSSDALHEFVGRASLAELPDAILLEPEAYGTPQALRVGLTRLRERASGVTMLCLAHQPASQWAIAALEGGARGYLLRSEVKIYVVSAIVFALEQPFIITPSVRSAAEKPFEVRIFNAAVLPSRREYPGMTERIRQALYLCVIEGMPAQLAADEMGVSPHTIRSYIKEGYRILETYDDAQYSDEIGPLERAFMRLTALENTKLP
jgi:DNA-binding NarL/FixJ family response regulator